MLDIIGNLEGWVTTVMEQLGEPGVGLLVLLENLFPPIPSEVILPLAGFTASQGEFLIISVILWATLGSVVGAIILYYVGALLGRDRTRAIFRKMPLVSINDVDRTEAWFIKYEAKTVFFGRMVPIFRSLISIPAGVERMNMVLFIAYTAAGSLVWNSTLIYLGFILGENFHLVENYVGIFQYVVIAVVLAAIGYFVVRRLRQKKTKQQ
jgi:membrane protein DedA with SNARE-associated domain